MMPAKRPVGRPRADGRPPLTKADVYAVAARLIAAQGYAGTSLRMIADELGASAPSISQLFHSKAGLLVGLVQMMAGVSIAFHERLAALGLPADVRLFKMVHEEVRAVSSATEAMVALFYLPELRQPEFAEARSVREAMLGFYLQTLQEGLGSGLLEVANPRLAAEQIFQLTETAIIAGDRDALGAPERMARETARFTLRGLLVDPERVDELGIAAAQIDLVMNTG